MFDDSNIAINPLAVLKSEKEPRRYTLAEFLRRSEKSEDLLEYYDGIITKLPKIGRASCRERVCMLV